MHSCQALSRVPDASDPHTQRDFTAWSNEHLKVWDQIMNAPRYLSSSNHGKATPVAVPTEAHATALLDPIREQHDFLVDNHIKQIKFFTGNSE